MTEGSGDRISELEQVEMSNHDEAAEKGPTSPGKVAIAVVIGLSVSLGAGWIGGQTRNTVDVAVMKQRLDDFEQRMTKLESTINATEAAVRTMDARTTETAADVKTLVTLARANKP